jgi:hypothetical protein
VPSERFLAGFLLSEFPFGLYLVPWGGLSLFSWSLELGIHILHIPQSCTNLFLDVEWFPSLFCLPITPLGVVTVPGLCVI